MVYLIDDDLHIRRAFELFLKSAEMPFQSYQNAEDFFEKSVISSKDVLVLDLNLPGISGSDLLNRLSNCPDKINVIVVTAYDEPLIRGHCKEFGVKAYLRKPVDSEALIDIIKYCVPS